MSYTLAVLDPFNSKAEGARVPDSYAFPTEAITFRAKYNVSTKGTFNLDWFDQVFKASPIDFLTMPVATGGSAGSSFEAVETSATQQTPTAKPPGHSTDWNQLAMYGWMASNQAARTANNKGTGQYKWSKYRVVGGGIRMRSQMIPEKTTGYFSFYSTESTRVDYSNELFTATDFTLPNSRAKLALHTGRPYVHTDSPSATTGDSSQAYAVVLNETMSEEPTGEILDCLSFNSKGCQMSFRPMTAQAYEWRNMTSAPVYDVFTEADGTATTDGSNHGYKNSEGTANSSIGYNPVLQAAPEITTTVGQPVQDVGGGDSIEFDESFYKTDGWNTLCVKGSQLPAVVEASGGQTPVMVVEVILHIEFISSEIGTKSFARPQPHNQPMLDEVARRAAQMPMYRTLFAGTVASANRNVRARNGY